MIDKATMVRLRHALWTMWSHKDSKRPLIKGSVAIVMMHSGFAEGASDCADALRDVKEVTDKNRREIIDTLHALYRDEQSPAEGMMSEQERSTWDSAYNSAIETTLTLLASFDSRLGMFTDRMCDWFDSERKEEETR